MQEATPSSADAAKRADLMRRLNNIISSGVAGYSGLHAEVHRMRSSSTLGMLNFASTDIMPTAGLAARPLAVLVVLDLSAVHLICSFTPAGLRLLRQRLLHAGWGPGCHDRGSPDAQVRPVLPLPAKLYRLMVVSSLVPAPRLLCVWCLQRRRSR